MITVKKLIDQSESSTFRNVSVRNTRNWKKLKYMNLYTKATSGNGAGFKYIVKLINF